MRGLLFKILRYFNTPPRLVTPTYNGILLEPLPREYGTNVLGGEANLELPSARYPIDVSYR
jgi:hypothetical protein